MVDETKHDDADLQKVQRELSAASDELGKPNFSNHATIKDAVNASSGLPKTAEQRLQEEHSKLLEFVDKYEKMIDEIDNFITNSKSALGELEENVKLARNEYKFTEQTNIETIKEPLKE